MGVSVPWGLSQNPMGFALGFMWGIFSKLNSHGVETFKIKYLKNYLKMFPFCFLITPLRIKKIAAKLCE